jgi:hypothetical protein
MTTKCDLNSTIAEAETSIREGDSHGAARTEPQSNTPPKAVASADKQANRDGIRPEDILEELDAADERGTLAIEYIHDARAAMSKLVSRARAVEQADRDGIRDLLEEVNAAHDHLTGALKHINDAFAAVNTLASRCGASFD